MAAAKKSKTARGRKQDRARVAGGQDYEVQYEAKKTGKSAPAGWRFGATRRKPLPRAQLLPTRAAWQRGRKGLLRGFVFIVP